jgi:sulfoxide reductase catalytic subunit YedY
MFKVVLNSEETMHKKTFFSGIPSSEITPETIYLSRRRFMKLAGVSASAALLAACSPTATQEPVPAETGQSGPQTPAANGPAGPLKDELGDPANTLEAITNYNNYYEFSQGKEMVAVMAEKFVTSPWQVEVSGLVNKPKTFGLEELLKFPQEERVYRLRCVEGWSMVIPWSGFPLAALLQAVEPTGSARYVRFTTANLPEQMPGLENRLFPWPYTEGLRLDEAMNDLTLLVTGLYGKPLPNQDGAPLRLALPWKYGFKSGKALVKIELVADQPATFWSTIAPQEYGFYANVNPDVPHPRWSQSTERRIGELSRRKTLLFNGYAEQVGQLYSGMDLQKNY